MKHFKKVVIGIGVALMVSGATVALAQDEVAPEAPEIPEAVALCLEANRTARDTALAEALGITLDEFNEMRDSGMNLRDIAEELGVDVPDPRDIEFETEDCREIAHAEVLAAAAEQLGMTVEDLQAMIDDGMTLREIAEEQGVELDLPNFGGPRHNGPQNNPGGPQNGGPGGNFGGPRGGGPGRPGGNNAPGQDAPEAPVTPEGEGTSA